MEPIRILLADDHTLFRKYASNLCRWLSPDPLAGDITNPQSLNRYSYVLNNCTNLTDPLGLFELIPRPPSCLVRPPQKSCEDFLL